MLRGGHCIRTWSSTQKSVSLSSGEAELVAVVKISGELIGLAQLLHDWGHEVTGSVYVDSSAALGTVRRKGNGKMRHVRVGHLWIQELAEEGLMSYMKVLGTENPADLMTKPLSWGVIEKRLLFIGLEMRTGTADSGLATL